MKLKKLDKVVFCLVLILISLSIYRFKVNQNSPKKSVLIAITSFEKKDKEGFDKFVSKRLSENIVDNLSDYMVSNSKNKIKTLFIKNIIESVSNMIKPGVKMAVNESLEDYFSNKEVNLAKRFSNDEKISRLINDRNFSLLRIGKTKITGKTAIVNYHIYHNLYKKEFRLEVKLIKKNNWKVINVFRLPILIDELEKWEENYLTKLNDPIKKAISKTIEIISITKKKKQKTKYSLFNYSIISLLVKNKSKKDIREIKGDIVIEDKKEKRKVQISFSSNKIDADKTIRVSVERVINSLLGDDNILLKKSKELKVRINIKKVKFSDLSEIKLYSEIPR